MRLVLPLLALLVVLSAAPALAHEAHGSCTTSKTLVNGRIVHVDSFTSGCGGVLVTVPVARCAGADPHLLLGVHTPLLYGTGCDTGVVLEPMALLA